MNTTDDTSSESRRRSTVSRGAPLYEQVARKLRNDIAAGVLRDGERLPSTRELAEEWDVSVFTINQAMQTLTDEGLVISKDRAGRVVHAPGQAQEPMRAHGTPRVIAIGGFAGSGKTELARVLARETGWPILDKDTLTRPVVEAALEALGQSPNDRESPVYLERVRPREYEALHAAMVENLQCGNSVILAAPFIKEFGNPGWLTRLEATCADLGAALHVVWVHCDPGTMHTYVRHRGAARDAAKLNDWAGYLKGLDTHFRPPVEHTVIDNCSTSEPLRDQAKRLLASLSEAATAAR
jgi:DNA-binding transcriptional regulator YhcF (GntR family)/predicted kinase